MIQVFDCFEEAKPYILELYNNKESTSEYDISKLFDVVNMIDKDLEMISELIDDAIHYIENKQNEQEG